MFKQQQKIALKGQVYATPKTESVEIMNQGVLCASAGGGGGGGGGASTFTLPNLGKGSL